MLYPFHQVDVFSDEPLLGNPLAVVHRADPFADPSATSSTESSTEPSAESSPDPANEPDNLPARFARWTNLSETTFLLRPTHPDADYRVRIFTPESELPFAGHPTLGTCHAWLEAGGRPRSSHLIVQECPAGLIRIRKDADRLAFAAPPLLRTGPVDAPLLDRLAAALGIPRSRIHGHQWVDNGPGWLALLLDSADTVLSLSPDHAALSDVKLGVIGPYPPGGPADFEVRAFVGPLGVPEDPVTGSLNAGIAQWLLPAGLAAAPYTVSQGTLLHRRGRIRIDASDGDIWVGGRVHTCLAGTLALPSFSG